MKKAVLILCSSLIAFQSQASLFLLNDSPFKLKAVVMAANGTNLGEKVLGPDETGYFEDSLGQSDPVGRGMAPPENAQMSITPYSVFWYCMEGTSYATCTNVGAGALSSPSGCEGAQYCKVPPKPPSQEVEQDSE